MAYKERKLTKDEAYALYNGINEGFDKKKKSTDTAKKNTAKSVKKGKKK